MTLKTYLDKLERGGSTKFAEVLGISPSYLSQLASGGAPVSPARAVQIEKASGGAVTRQELRDDWKAIWPELSVKRNRANPTEQQSREATGIGMRMKPRVRQVTK